MSDESFPRTSRDGTERLMLHHHADVVEAAHDPERFSSAVSRHLQVPNGMDGAEHTAYRELLDPFFNPGRMARLAPVLAAVAKDVVSSIEPGTTFDAVGDLGSRYSVRAQSHWLGWPIELEETLLTWVQDNRSASRSGDRQQTQDVADRFDAIITSLLADRQGHDHHQDVTAEIMDLRKPDGSRLSHDEVVSVLRNWTGGDLSTVALCAGVVAHWLAEHPEEQAALATAETSYLDAAIDEMLRLDDPFVTNRRVATADTTIGGCPVASGEKLFLNWRTANVDPAAFDDPLRFDPLGNASRNLVYGTGPHVCPGRPLATLELRILVRALLAAGTIEFDPTRPPVREQPPVAGFRNVWIRLAPAA